jgi:hypothetical protein
MVPRAKRGGQRVCHEAGAAPPICREHDHEQSCGETQNNLPQRLFRRGARKPRGNQQTGSGRDRQKKVRQSELVKP